MDSERLAKILAEFFLDSLREDAGDVGHWCAQGDESPDDIVEAINRHIQKT